MQQLTFLRNSLLQKSRSIDTSTQPLTEYPVLSIHILKNVIRTSRGTDSAACVYKTRLCTVSTVVAYVNCNALRILWLTLGLPHQNLPDPYIG